MLSDRIKEARKYLNIATQQDLATLANIKLSRIQDIERGKVKELKAEELIILQEKLLINSWWILTGTGEITVDNKSLIINYREEIIKNLDKLEDKQIKYIYHYTESEKIKK